MFDQKDWERRVRYFTNGDTTFEEAYKKTGRVLCITLSATTKKAPPVLINYITAPNVTIASAVLASAAVPGFIDPMKLQVKDENGVVKNQAKQDEEYRDGSIESDIPTNGLAEMVRVFETSFPVFLRAKSIKLTHTNLTSSLIASFFLLRRRIPTSFPFFTIAKETWGG
jgi:predicted acylesterase/phospholipase RssA